MNVIVIVFVFSGGNLQLHCWTLTGATKLFSQQLFTEELHQTCSVERLEERRKAEQKPGTDEAGGGEEAPGVHGAEGHCRLTTPETQ